MSDNKFTPCNNQFQDCPAIMSDGRNFTDYRPINHINNLLIMNNNLENNYSYREFLIQNAEKIMDMNRDLIYENNKCDQCPDMFKENADNTLNKETTCEECGKHQKV
tara:strand:+ start:1746 stop:2066 length:321 start_codon:yes stop_codon:yes gene_type:complete